MEKSISISHELDLRGLIVDGHWRIWISILTMLMWQV